jgi:transcriptional regulator with XRE-family HTH domain
MDKSQEVPAHLARNLLNLRHVRSLTQEALAKAAGVPRSTIANLESGDGNPSLAVLVKVAGALRAPIDELLASPRAKVRKWAAQDLSSRNRGRGVTTRPLVPEPVPQEILELMEFAPDATLGGTPHLPGTREFFSMPRGPGHDLRRGRALRRKGGRGARFSRQRGALLSKRGQDRKSSRRLGCSARQGRGLTATHGLLLLSGRANRSVRGVLQLDPPPPQQFQSHDGNLPHRLARLKRKFIGQRMQNGNA